MSLESCKIELRSIVREIQDIEQGVRRDFSGIGQDLCANCIDRIADKYAVLSRELDRVDMNWLAELAAKLSGED